MLPLGSPTNHIVHCWDGQSAEIASKKFHTPAKMPKTLVSFPESIYSKLYPVVEDRLDEWRPHRVANYDNERSALDLHTPHSRHGPRPLDGSTPFNLSPNMNVHIYDLYLPNLSIMYNIYVHLYIWSLLLSDPCMCSWFEWLGFRTCLATWRGSSWKVPVFGNWKRIVPNTLQAYSSLNFNTSGTCMLLPGHSFYLRTLLNPFICLSGSRNPMDQLLS